jgi:hypothetical protein
MKPEHYKPRRKEKPGRVSKTRKSQMPAGAQQWKPITSPQLREAYSAKIDWAKKLIPQLKAETPQEKEESR